MNNINSKSNANFSKTKFNANIEIESVIENIDSIQDEEMIIYRKNNKIREKVIFYEFMNFLEVFIHSIIYLSEVYPKKTFTEYKIYNLHFLKFNIDDTVIEYINEFLKNIENLLFSRFINKIYILIIDADSNTLIEKYNLEVTFAQVFYDLNYEDLCLNFKSILYKLFISNTSISNNDLNKTFLLCVETNENKVLSNIKLFEEIISTVEEKFIKNLFQTHIIKLLEKRDFCVIMDDVHFSLNISRNYL